VFITRPSYFGFLKTTAHEVAHLELPPNARKTHVQYNSAQADDGMYIIFDLHSYESFIFYKQDQYWN